MTPGLHEVKRCALCVGVLLVVSGCPAQPPAERVAPLSFVTEAPFELPPSYLRAVDVARNEEHTLDWRAIGHASKPPMWPGLLVLFRKDEVARQNQRLNAMRAPGPPLFFIGTNTAGVVFALEANGTLVVLDDVELEERFLIAPSFDAMFASASTKRAGLPVK